MLSTKFDPLEENLLRDTFPLLQPSPVSRSALPKGQLKENSEELLVLVEGSGWWLMFLLHSPVCLMTDVAQDDKLQSDGALVAPDVEGPAEQLPDEGEGDEEEDEVPGSLTPLLLGAVGQSLADAFKACRLGMKMERSDERLSLELLLKIASSCCCWRFCVAALPLLEAKEDEDEAIEEEQEGPSAISGPFSDSVAAQ